MYAGLSDFLLDGGAAKNMKIDHWDQSLRWELHQRRSENAIYSQGFSAAIALFHQTDR